MRVYRMAGTGFEVIGLEKVAWKSPPSVEVARPLLYLGLPRQLLLKSSYLV